MAKRILIPLGILITAGVLIAPNDLSSCGPFLPITLFSGKFAPVDQPRFFRGQFDILQPRYRHIFLMAAYRYLSGVGLTKPDQEALLAPPSGPEFWMDTGSPAIQAWLAARVQLGAPRLQQIDRFKLYDQQAYVLNCGDDAFRSATATLIERGGAAASHDELRDWIAAQDQVFANCSAKPAPSIPALLPPTASPWMQAGRAYQIASAKFYAGQFDAASADFQRIAADRSSPWHAIAPYLVARALIRKTTLLDPTAAPAAQEQLRKVLADPDAATWHASARGLDRYLRARIEPDLVFSELARIIETQKSDVAGPMNDYRLMLDHFTDHNQNPPRDDDLTDWISTMQLNADDHALVKWRATRSLPWLVAALTYADKPDAELMAAAAQVPDDSPAFLTVELHRLRLMPTDEARATLDRMLRRKMPVSARNLFLAERMRLARNWNELLRDAPRTAAATTNDYNATEDPVTSRAQRYFDDDSTRILDRQVPLAMLVEAAHNPSLPAGLQLQIARAGWVRSILLNDVRTASGIVPVLLSLAPYLKPYLDAYISASDDQTRSFAAAWLMLNNPGMRPSIEVGEGRLSAIPKLDQFRDNWWCPAGAGPSSGAPPSGEPRLNAALELLYQGSAPEAAFLSPALRAAARVEQERLASAPAAPTLLARLSVEWTKAHPDDPRAPEALHLAVRASRYACGGDSDTGTWSKRAFHLLHDRYPKTEASRRTPFWYR